MTITHKELMDLIHYDPETGVFTANVKFSKRTLANRVLSNIDSKGYYRVCIKRKDYKLHRLAYFYMTGTMPDKWVDHINGITTDNRWCNLRIVTELQSSHNRKKPSNNTSGIKGVCFNKRIKRWRVKIGVNGKVHELGHFKDIEEAKAVYEAAAIKYFGEYKRAA